MSHQRHVPRTLRILSNLKGNIMAAAKKTAAKKTTARPSPKKASKKVPAKKPTAKKTSKKSGEAEDRDEEELEWMEVKKSAKKAGKKFAKLDLNPIKIAAKVVGKGKKAHKVKAKKLSASQVLNHVVEQCELPRKDVRLVLETLANTIKAAIMPGAVGGAVIPGVGAIVRKEIPAKKLPAIARGTVVEKRNPRTGEVTKVKHPGRKASVKPASSKARAVLLSSTRRAVFGTV
jgi:hypothetical protein